MGSETAWKVEKLDGDEWKIYDAAGKLRFRGTTQAALAHFGFALQEVADLRQQLGEAEKERDEARSCATNVGRRSVKRKRQIKYLAAQLADLKGDAADLRHFEALVNTLDHFAAKRLAAPGLLLGAASGQLPSIVTALEAQLAERDRQAVAMREALEEHHLSQSSDAYGSAAADAYKTSELCDKTKAALSSPAPTATLECGICKQPMSRNPHPNAGKPETLVSVGAYYQCIPCTVRSRHDWAQRAMKAERDADSLWNRADAARSLLKNFPLDADKTYRHGDPDGYVAAAYLELNAMLAPATTVGSEDAKPTKVVALVQFPNEPNAVLKFGDTEIHLSATFIHYWKGVLAMSRKHTHEGAYERDYRELENAIGALWEEMLPKCRRQTQAEENLLRERYQKTGQGYWSSWMNRGTEECPWGKAFPLADAEGSP